MCRKRKVVPRPKPRKVEAERDEEDESESNVDEGADASEEEDESEKEDDSENESERDDECEDESESGAEQNKKKRERRESTSHSATISEHSPYTIRVYETPCVSCAAGRIACRWQQRNNDWGTKPEACVWCKNRKRRCDRDGDAVSVAVREIDMHQLLSSGFTIPAVLEIRSRQRKGNIGNSAVEASPLPTPGPSRSPKRPRIASPVSHSNRNHSLSTQAPFSALTLQGIDKKVAQLSNETQSFQTQVMKDLEGIRAQIDTGGNTYVGPGNDSSLFTFKIGSFVLKF